MTPAVQRAHRARPSLRQEAKALFRDAVLHAAEEVFAERGFHGARIQDIAARARVGVGTVYNHFTQKEEVLRALLDERGASLLADFAARPDDPAAWEPRLRARWRRAATYVQAHGSFFRLACEIGLFGTANPALAAALGKGRVERQSRFQQEMRTLIEEGIATGALAPAEPQRLQRFLGGAIRGALEGALRDGEGELIAEVDATIDLFLRAAGAPRKGAR